MDIEKQLKTLGQGIVPQVWEDMREPLREKLKLGRPLRIKLGCDPTAPDLHLGHTVVLDKLRQFQDFGHHVLFLVGDFTALIGDPTGKSQTRPPLDKKELKKNTETYKSQVFKILDPERTEVVFNSTWLAKLSAEEIIRLAAKYTVARLLERHEFRTRYDSGQPIGIHEFLYPLLQGYDSVVLKADVELGGNDQLFNLMVGRALMKEFGLSPQIVLTRDLLIGTDGHLENGTLVGEKMSKSLGNYIAIEDPPAGENGMYGKLMSISDPLMWHYYEVLCLLSDEKLALRRTEHPKETKKALAFEITARFHGETAAKQASQEFDRLHPTAGISRGTPEEIEEIALTLDEPTIFLSHALVQADLAQSNGAARRLISQGGVQLDGERITDTGAVLNRGSSYLVKVGKRRFRKITL
ncbi:MAG: tyrosine--tRNA ligase [Pseudomonadota bacterium]